MKRFLLLIFLFAVFIFSSCNDKKITELKAKVSRLEIENNNLKDSISDLKVNELYDFQILGFTERSKLKLNEEAKINFAFAPRKDILTYDVYKKSETNNDVGELILKNQDFSEFEYYFTPKKLGESRIDLITIFDLDSMSVEIPAVLFVDVVE